ncbi:flagellar biosynthesis protein FlhF [Acetobacter fallax]|uniref:SRP54-type proteins GTP-binding domain-containing protein n=1 Tax=Acetobacter fallax TaxID=1737473 RepID=A0ABX0KCG8_9PROT|nr:hypothetical protein [Acetobacter fallax]NHO33841.1 hypothetical protein [Acetobacter fallax]NHO37381.1 hypothetical protein [Acetobacter fallax]
MKLRTFSGVNMKDAVRQVRATLGESALILSERVTGSGVEVIAATDVLGPDLAEASPVCSETLPNAPDEKLVFTGIDQDVSRFSPLTDEVDPATSDTLRDALLWHRIPDVLVDDLTTSPLSVAISKLVRFGSFSFSLGKSPLALVGPPGSGKTLSVAKLATRLVLSDNTPLVITTDRERGGGIDQLAVHTRRLGIPLLAAHDTDTLKRALHQRRNGQPVLIDTASADPYAADTLAILTELTSATRAQLCLTLPAGYDTEESADIAEIFSKARTRMMIATRLDQARRVGNVITAAACGLVLTEAGISNATAGGLVRLTPRMLASRLAYQGDPPAIDPAVAEQDEASATQQKPDKKMPGLNSALRSSDTGTASHSIPSLARQAVRPSALAAM